MKTTAAVVFKPHEPWQIVELDLEPPRHGELRVRVEYAGLCHSDAHFTRGGSLFYPLVGGHEGAGVVEEVGPGVDDIAVGDHVVMSWIPSCGTCRWCTTGQSYICDLGALIATGELPGGGTRFSLDGQGIGGACVLGTFSRYLTVSRFSVVKVPGDFPLDLACLLGCGVPTGWGAAVNVADVRPGEVVAVYGAGGIGVNAVQGAARAGARCVVVIDPVPFKLDFARGFGATHGFTSHDEAAAFLMDSTRGVLADKVIVTVGTMASEVFDQAEQLTRKGGTLVLVSMSDDVLERTAGFSGMMFTLFAKRIVGALYGGYNPRYDIVRLLELYRAGGLKLDELITRRYPLEAVNDGYADLAAGRNIRGVLEIAH